MKPSLLLLLFLLTTFLGHGQYSTINREAYVSVQQPALDTLADTSGIIAADEGRNFQGRIYGVHGPISVSPLQVDLTGPPCPIYDSLAQRVGTPLPPNTMSVHSQVKVTSIPPAGTMATAGFKAKDVGYYIHCLSEQHAKVDDPTATVRSGFSDHVEVNFNIYSIQVIVPDTVYVGVGKTIDVPVTTFPAEGGVLIAKSNDGSIATAQIVNTPPPSPPPPPAAITIASSSSNTTASAQNSGPNPPPTPPRSTRIRGISPGYVTVPIQFNIGGKTFTGLIRVIVVAVELVPEDFDHGTGPVLISPLICMNAQPVFQSAIWEARVLPDGTRAIVTVKTPSTVSLALPDPLEVRDGDLVYVRGNTIGDYELEISHKSYPQEKVVRGATVFELTTQHQEPVIGAANPTAPEAIPLRRAAVSTAPDRSFSMDLEALLHPGQAAYNNSSAGAFVYHQYQIVTNPFGVWHGKVIAPTRVTVRANGMLRALGSADDLQARFFQKLGILGLESGDQSLVKEDTARVQSPGLSMGHTVPISGNFTLVSGGATYMTENQVHALYRARISLLMVNPSVTDPTVVEGMIVSPGFFFGIGPFTIRL